VSISAAKAANGLVPSQENRMIPGFLLVR
jgi:hypothetical protein